MIDRAEAVSRQVDILRSTGELSPAELEAIGIRLQEYAEEAAEPVFVRVLFGLGGWFAAIFLIISIQFVVQGKGLLSFGLVLLIVAVGLSRAGKTIFSSQLALALAFAGNVGILTGAASVIPGDTWFVVPVLQFFLCLALYPLLPLATFRFAAPASVVLLSLPWIVAGDPLRLHLLVAAELILFLTLSLRKKKIPAFFPLERAAALLLPVTLLGFHLFRITSTTSSSAPLWPSGLILWGALLIILFHPVFGPPPLSPFWKLGLPAAFLLPGLFTSPGVPAALLLLLLGRARGECFLTVLGGLSLPLFIGFYYYELDMDLAHKTWLMAGSGLLLLGLRRLTEHFRSREEIP